MAPTGLLPGVQSKLWRESRVPWNAILGPLLVASVAINVHQYNLLQELALRKLTDPATCCSCCESHERLEFALVPRPRASPISETGPRQSSFLILEPADGRHLASGQSHSPSPGAASNNPASSSHTSHSSHNVHQQDAMLFLFNALVVGAAVLQLSSIYPLLQSTVLLFVLGLIFSLFMEGLDLKDSVGVWGTSYKMWITIDPHLFMFALLPCLLAGDAMSIDTSVAKRVAYQCLYLAGPGVAVCAFATALFLKAFLGWSFLLSMVAGAILCATDPVAVVALLKELGASPVLTIQIQGESLLNDGTAIVVFLISYNMLSGEDYDYADVAMFLVKKAMMACALGLFIGYAFFSWIRAAANRLNHSSSIIQISLTLCCAYWSFIIVEGVLKLSGVLAVVGSSLVLAHHMWPHIVAQESLHHVWHMFETLGNIIVFFLAGALTGDVITKTDTIDFLNLFVIYIFLTCLRGALIFGSMPLLRRLGQDEVNFADAALMTWGGLRGAVGLVLAIQVHNDLAPNSNGVPQINEKEGRRLLFFVSGIAFLTMVINAVTAPMLVSRLGITALPHARQQLLRMFHQQLVNWSEDEQNPADVTESLRKMLHEAEADIKSQRIAKDGPTSRRVEGGITPVVPNVPEPLNEPSPSLSSPVDRNFSLRKTTGNLFNAQSEVDNYFQSNRDVIEEFEKERERFKSVSEADLRYVLARLPEGRDLASEDYLEMVTLIKDQWVDVGMAKVVNATLLNLVYHNYWKLIEAGDLRPGSKESDFLLTSIRVSLSPYSPDVADFRSVSDQLNQELGNLNLINGVTAGNIFDDDYTVFAANAAKNIMSKIVSSIAFNVVISATIFLNSIQVAVEEAARNADNDKHITWLILDGVFCTIFFVEFVLKFILLGRNYFRSGWNRFDFFLAALGVFGFVVAVIARESGGGDNKSVSGEARIIRVARVLRTLRFLRVFRLLHARLSADKQVSVELANHMIKIQCWTCFMQAHLMGQEDMIKYFGGNGKLDTIEEAEMARCILQSQIGVYKALKEVVCTQKRLQKPLLEELYTVTERKVITEGLETFVMDAHHHGALSAREAHTILHHLHQQISECLSLIYDRSEGLLDSNMAERVKEAEEEGVRRVSSRHRTQPKFGHNRSSVTHDDLSFVQERSLPALASFSSSPAHVTIRTSDSEKDLETSGSCKDVAWDMEASVGSTTILESSHRHVATESSHRHVANPPPASQPYMLPPSMVQEDSVGDEKHAGVFFAVLPPQPHASNGNSLAPGHPVRELS